MAKQINLKKYDPRPGIFIGCPPELRAKFDEQRGEHSRREWLEILMLLAEGVGEVEA